MGGNTGNRFVFLKQFRVPEDKIRPAKTNRCGVELVSVC